MKKLNNKGFMMAEVVVVSSVVLLVLTSLYMSYGKIYSIYKQRINYYDVSLLAELGYKRDEMIDTEEDDDNVINKLIKDETEYKLLLDNNELEKIIWVKKDKISAIKGTNISYTLTDYIDYLLNNSNSIKSNYLMIYEKCNNEKDNCKYAYLEIYDGNEITSN